ncbi:hypothetical protein BDF20DRAFT_535994 [Mycotypha africana]|uniref:uncharacterized protein n=1 Tax=Mycotypha africana TaxID=64632 RepID=UPI002300EFD5|nr:uncharacterized protein BDF20DRAFT_535994 [Mycotypha africana]KAI8979847.1 hypothetical protein BDF20DRAFT_535994 [Mycotypha africana]
MTTLQVYAHRLSDPNLAVGLKVTIANELRDQVEVFQTQEYPRFLATLIPVFMDVLQNGSPVFQSNAPEQKLRNIILEIIYRLPQTEALKEYIPDLCKTLMNLLRVENEDNAVVCVKIIIDYHRTYRQLLEDQVQPFLDLVQEIFKNMEQTVKDVFDAPCTPIGSATPGINPLLATSPRPNSPAAVELPETPSKPLAKSMFSFKVLTECPIIVVLLFQTHRRFAAENIIKFVPLIFQLLSLQAKPQAEAASAVQARGEVFVGVSPEIRNRAVYNDFIVAQVKTMSFLAFILRSYTAVLRPFQNQIPNIVLRLLCECPPESSATRKELLVATRHILSTDFRASFVSKIDLLLNEKVLIGTGVTSHDTLRPLAYSMLADLVHHIRSELTPAQLRRTVRIYTRNLHDHTLASSIQTMCGKLLLNLIDCIIKIPNKKEGRDLLMRILDAFASKFASLNMHFKTFKKQFLKKKQEMQQATITEIGQQKPNSATSTNMEKEPSETEQDTEQSTLYDDFDFDKARSIHTQLNTTDSPQDSIKEIRFIFKNFAIGLKPLFIGLRHCNPAPPQDVNLQSYSQYARDFSQEDIQIFIRLLREGLKCFEYYNVDNYGLDGSLPHEADEHYKRLNSSKDPLRCIELSNRIANQVIPDSEALDMFGVVFTVLDPAVFQEIFVSQMSFIFDRMLINTSLTHIVNTFVAQEISSTAFAPILLNFLMERLEHLGDKDLHYSAIFLHLFRLIFMAMNYFPEANEATLQPYLTTLIMSCFKLSAKTKESAIYFSLLLLLFKGIGGGRFEKLYKEVSPLLHFILENLNQLITVASRYEVKMLYVELCLTVPVRLSTLLPYLPLLMRPLVLGLQGSPELVTQSLRTLELCNDNLNPEFLNETMEPIKKELMNALWQHIRPLPYNQQHSHTAIRILGKLGGKNRRILNTPPDLDFKRNTESGIAVAIYFDPNSTPQSLPLDECLEVACQTLEKSDVDSFYKKHAYEFLKSNIIIMLDMDEGPEDLAQRLHQRIRRFILKVETKDGEEVEDNVLEKVNADNSIATDVSDKMDIEDGQVKNDSTVVGDTLNKFGFAPKRLINNGYTKYLAKRIAQEETLRTMLISILRASVYSDLSEDAWLFFRNICRHFMLLHIGEVIDGKEKAAKPVVDMMDERLADQYFHATVLVDAIVKTLTSGDAKLRSRAEQSILFCFEIVAKALGCKNHISQLPIFRVFASQFCSCCYKSEWFTKRGGCQGISIITSQLEMGTQWMRDHELDFIRSLLFVLKDVQPGMSNINNAEATQTLSHVLKVCNRPDDSELPEAQKKFQNLIALLLSELSNSNSVVRETIQSSFQLLADLTGNEVTEILAPVRERLLAPIFAKPLRALPFAMQIGNIDAITYCLTLRPPFLEFNDELIRLLHEALALADAEDQALVSRSSQYKNASSLMNLRIVCIRLLSAAMACSEFLNQRQSHTPTRIIQVFFKSLYSKSPEVVEAAHRGLKQVLSLQIKLPKELLQQGLRPILTTLSNHKTLSVAGLEGLARLLELLTSYFKVEIGKKLLDHLKLWADPTVLQQAANQNLSDNYEVKIIVAILNIFHLLPAAAHIFLDEIVTIVLDMESYLRRSISSPFRSKLFKYLNRYPAETVTYFFERLDQPRFNHLLIDTISNESSVEVRAEIAKRPAQLIEKSLAKIDDYNLRYQGIMIVKQVVKYDAEWLSSQPEILENLLKLWRYPGRFDAMKKDDDEGHQMYRETLCLSHIFILYLKLNPDNIELIFDLATLFAQETVMDLSYLREFFLVDVALRYPPEKKKLIVGHFLQQFNDASVTSYSRMMILRHIINPAILVSMLRKNEEITDLLSQDIMEQLNSKIWARLNAVSNAENDQYAEDSLRIELLQLTSMIVQHSPRLLTDLRKEVIKFGWHYLRLEDATCKQAAYVLIAHFITAFETPSKIVIQMYAALLRAHLSEARTLVKQGLDIIAPVLPKRVPLLNNERIPTWVRLTRKVIVEDTHSISQIVNVYQLLVRQSDLFFDYREHFLPQIVNTLPKLGLPNATPENKLLTVELAELLLNWEQKRLQSMETSEDDIVTLPSGKRLTAFTAESTKKKQKTEGSVNERNITNAQVSVKVASGANHNKVYIPSLGLRENVIGYLVRLACSVYNPSDVIQRKLVQRVITLIRNFLDPSIWPDVHVKFTHLERALTFKEINEISLPAFCSALEILAIDIAHKPVEWFTLNMSQIFRLLENSIKSDNIRIQTTLQPVLSRVFLAINQSVNNESPEEVQHPDVAAFCSLVDSAITDGLTNANNAYTVLQLLQACSSGRSEQLDPFIPGMVKMLQKLTKEHLSAAHSVTSNSETPVNLLKSILDLLKRRISYLGDQRRVYLSCLNQIIEKSSDIDLLRSILDTLKDWILNRKEAFPTIIEKAGLLAKMMNFESRDNKQLTEEYLDLILKIYSNPSFSRTELTVRLEQAFLMGTRNENPTIRHQFMRVFDRSINRTVYTRLNYILGVQNWESLSSTFWIHQALDLLLGSVKIQPSITAPHALKIRSIGSIGGTMVSAESDLPVDISELIQQHQSFLKELKSYDVNIIIDNTRSLQYMNDDTAYRLWISLFPLCWDALSAIERHDMAKLFIYLLAKDFHNKQVELRPNVIQALLSGIAKITNEFRLPPHLLQHLGKTHNAWHTAIEILQRNLNTTVSSEKPKDDVDNNERTLDALAELFTSLEEHDMLYGLWKRRSTYGETAVAISYEQSELWSEAQLMYENAQIKARSGVSPFTESEYSLWEDHWVLCAQKLQQWDILLDLAKNENNTSLFLECAWRQKDWIAEHESLEHAVAQLTTKPSPRLKAMEAFLALIRSQSSNDKFTDFTRISEEGIQLTLQQWFSLPQIVSQSHVPLLHMFQQYYELHEASQLLLSLQNTNAQNFPQRSNELRSVLVTWRGRLPNMWDDINVWSELVSWRQHIFDAINHAYRPFIPLLTAQDRAPLAYRGYQENAWLINQFAHVARKHQLNDFCAIQLNKIYTLPNMEIQEVFVRLREYAKYCCQIPSELPAGLELVSSTNTKFFTVPQQADIFTLKGQFLTKMKRYSEANEAFVNAVQLDLSLPRAWAEWGFYNDFRFKENPKELSWANNAVSCYLQAAGIYKNAKARTYLLRVLWLLSLDDEEGTVSRAFDCYKGEWPIWYWITFIPQLLMGLHQREAQHARNILIRIAKQYPQALHFQLRTAKEDMAKRLNATFATKQTVDTNSSSANSSNEVKEDASKEAGEDTLNDEVKEEKDNIDETPLAKETEGYNVNDEATNENTESEIDQNKTEPLAIKQEYDKNLKSSTVVQTDLASVNQSNIASPAIRTEDVGKEQPVIDKTSNENTASGGDQKGTPAATSSIAHPLDEIMAMLKTGYPLLALSMETMVDQIQLKFKPQADEEMYRLVVALYNEGVEQLLSRMKDRSDPLELSNSTVNSIARFANSLYPGYMKAAFVHDFVNSKLGLEGYIAKLRLWRDKFEAVLDARPRKQKLESSSHYLVEFQHQKFDDVEIPGQYLLLKDNANDFLRIDRFLPEVEIVRNYGNCYRRLTIRGHDGSLHPFVIQNPAARQFRREERLMQLFRLLNRILERKIVSRKRNLQFHLPVIVPLAPNVRMVEDDLSYCTLYDVYEDYCDSIDMHKDDPLAYFVDKLKMEGDRNITDEAKETELLNSRIEINEKISKQLVPSDILSQVSNDGEMINKMKTDEQNCLCSISKEQ